MAETFKFFILSNDKAILDEYSGLIKAAGYPVVTCDSGEKAWTQINDVEPDCVICDLTRPDTETSELFQKIRKKSHIRPPVLIAITNFQHLNHLHREVELGADAYIDIPMNHDDFMQALLKHLQGRVVIEFWGCRGTLTVPGKKTVIYGGNTNCVTMSFANKELFIFDAGTGFKELSNYFIHRNKYPIEAKLFITHPHYDHICGIPYFAPLYIKENRFEILGPNQQTKTLDQVISGQMDRIYFPVAMKEVSAQIKFHSLNEEEFKDNGVTIKSMVLNHPGRCLGYRIEYQDKSICYITDNELYLKDSPQYQKSDDEKLIQFIKQADVLIIDATYTDEEYQKKIGWGHSCISRVVEIAHLGEVKLLCLHHHDPDQTDKDIDQKLHQAVNMLKKLDSSTQCMIPHEGDRIVI